MVKYKTYVWWEEIIFMITARHVFWYSALVSWFVPLVSAFRQHTQLIQCALFLYKTSTLYQGIRICVRKMLTRTPYFMYQYDNIWMIE